MSQKMVKQQNTHINKSRSSFFLFFLVKKINKPLENISRVEKGCTNIALFIMEKTGMSKIVKYSTFIKRNTAALKEQGKFLCMDMKKISKIQY